MRPNNALEPQKENDMRACLLFLGLFLAAPSVAADSYSATAICGHVSDVGERQECVDKATAIARLDQSPKTVPAWFSFIWPVGWWVIYYGLALIIGLFVFRDARNRAWLFLGIRPVWWLFLVLFDAPLGLLVYWATHYSKLAQNYSEALATQGPGQTT